MNLKAHKFDEKIKNIKNSFFSALADFQKYYVFYNKNPEYSEYQQMFENIKGNLQNINSDLFMTSNNVEKDTENINDRLQKINALIAKEKMKNKQLKKKLGIVEKKYNGSDELISDYKEIYNLDYLTNFALFFGIIGLGSILVSKFKGPVTPKV